MQRQLEPLNNMKALNIFASIGLSILVAGTTVFAQNQAPQPPMPPTPGGGGPGGFGGGPGGPGGFFGGGPGGPGGFFGRGRIIDPPNDFSRPPTLRIGLITALKEIGGPDAETAIAEVLKTTARGVELAYATAILEKLAPGKYKNLALSGAKDLLLHPVSIENPTRYDRDSNAYLYGVLVLYQDKSFVPQAQSILVTAEGRLDGSTMEYLTKMLEGPAIMPVVSQVYFDARITNQFDKMSVLGTGLRYTGVDMQANRIFTDIMSKEDSGFMRFMALRSLTRVDSGQDGAPAPNNQQLLVGRQQLLQSVASSLANDERLSAMAQQTAADLQNLVEGKPVENRGFGGGFRGRPGGGDAGGGRGQ